VKNHLRRARNDSLRLARRAGYASLHAKVLTELVRNLSTDEFFPLLLELEKATPAMEEIWKKGSRPGDGMEPGEGPTN